MPDTEMRPSYLAERLEYECAECGRVKTISDSRAMGNGEMWCPGCLEETEHEL